MKTSYRPVIKRGMADRLAGRLRAMIRDGEYQVGDRLPSIVEMASRFGAGLPTLREGLKKLETMGFIEIRHGAGVFVNRSDDVLVVASPDFAGTVTRKLLLDLINVRMPLEMQAVSDAIANGSDVQLREMRRMLEVAGSNLANDIVLVPMNMSFHREIAVASGNIVLKQIIEVLQDLFMEEQRVILDIFGSRERDHREHVLILEAIEKRDVVLGLERMRAHLEGVADAIRRWDPDQHPTS
jgi:GntR family transcriptional repressor for pyruvate dehydrogenase complex